MAKNDVEFGNPELIGEQGAYQYKDIYDVVDETTYVLAGTYTKGFAIVYVKGKKMYRDMVGNVTDEPTDLGKTFYEFINNRLPALDIPDEYLADEKLFHYVILHEESRLEYDYLGENEDEIINERIEILKERREAILNGDNENVDEEDSDNLDVD